MNYNYQDAPRESQQEYFGKVHTDNKETLQNALKRIEELEVQIEKMKCCGNCKYQVRDECGEFCDYEGMSGISGDCDKWEIKND